MKPIRWAKVVVSPEVAAKVAAAAARVGLAKEQAMEIAASEPRNAIVFAGPVREMSSRKRVTR